MTYQTYYSAFLVFFACFFLAIGIKIDVSEFSGSSLVYIYHIIWYTYVTYLCLFISSGPRDLLLFNLFIAAWFLLWSLVVRLSPVYQYSYLTHLRTVLLHTLSIHSSEFPFGYSICCFVMHNIYVMWPLHSCCFLYHSVKSKSIMFFFLKFFNLFPFLF